LGPTAATPIASAPRDLRSISTAVGVVARPQASCRRLLGGMSNIKTRLHQARAKLLRRSSATSTATATRSIASSGSERPTKPNSSLRKSVSLSRLPEADGLDADDDAHRLSKSAVLPRAEDSSHDRHFRSAPTADDPTDAPHPLPEVTLEAPTPLLSEVTLQVDRRAPVPVPEPSLSSAELRYSSDDPSALPSASTRATTTPPDFVRCQSVVANTDAKIITTLLADAPPPAVPANPPAVDYFGGVPATFTAAMLHRKIWVKRPNASATLVQIREDDVVDDVRDMILKKYTNSLGRSFDAPDVTLRIVPRDAARGQDRTLGPEEDMCRTLDAYFPGGQHVTEALIIDVPQRRTPKASPRVPAYYAHHDDASHHETEYFPPMPVIQASPAASHPEQRPQLPPAPHSIAVLHTGHLPPLPSPGGTMRRNLHHPGRASRPSYPRHATASPTALTGGIPSSVTSARPPNRPRHDSSASEAKNSSTSNNPIPTPPPSIDPNARQQSSSPTPRAASPGPAAVKRRKKKPPLEAPSLPAGLLDGSVPPINVLIVEDNIINLRVLGAFMQRLKVRWQRAMNGKEAVTKWKAGGFHLVLMDIQLPVMNGLEATKEIRRLERVNSIGVFSSGGSEAPNTRLGGGSQDGTSQEETRTDELDANDRLGVDKGLFKSPVIIVALTASSLQSDRHEALAAGCNDFLTKVGHPCYLDVLSSR
jgi:osomolarity two-component system response regulator SSK1